VKTMKQREAEAAKLEKMLPTVRPSSAFGDNHHDAIRAQIEILRGTATEEDYDNEEQYGQNVLDNARLANDWIDGNGKEPPSKGWKSLVIK